jgi:hypothetical protein
MREREKPVRFQSLDHLLRDAARITSKKRIGSLSEALTALCDSFPGQIASKHLTLAGKLARSDPDLSFAWVDGIITHLLTSTDSAATWFARPKSIQFLFTTNIARSSFRETQLRMIADYALSKFLPEQKISYRIISESPLFSSNSVIAITIYSPADRSFYCAKS